MDAITQLDGIIRQALGSLAQELAAGHWKGRREREVVSLFCFGHLLRHCAAGKVLHDPTRHKGLQLAILLAELTELAHLRRAEIAELALPPVVRLLADLMLAAELPDRHAALALPEDVHHLLRREFACAHRPVSLLVWGP